MGARALSGSWVGLSTIVADGTGSFTIPGVGVISGKRALTLPLSYGSFALTGEPATLRSTRIALCGYGAFALTGFGSSGALVEPIVAFGAFALTGEPATLRSTRIALCGYGAFALTGEPAALTQGRSLTATYRAFALTGEPAGLTQERSLTAAYGAFALTGEPATLLAVLPGAFTLTAAYGSFALIGEPAAFSGVAPLGAGSFVLTGEPQALLWGRRGVYLCGVFALTGEAAGLTVSASTPPVVLSAAGGTFALSGEQLLRQMDAVLQQGEIGLYGKTSFREFGGEGDDGVFEWTAEAAGLIYGRALLAATGAYGLTGFGMASPLTRAMAAAAGDFSLSVENSAMTITRLGGVPGYCAIVWKPAGKTLVDWVS